MWLSFRFPNEEIGLIVPELLDIRSVPANFDSATFHERGVIGSQVINRRTTRLLDPNALIRLARPDWFVGETNEWMSLTGTNDPVDGDCSEAARPFILLAEDSRFFRNNVKSFLEEFGMRVMACEDGLEAWQTLVEGDFDFDLVLTDIEMPNMDGLELTRKIRASRTVETPAHFCPHHTSFACGPSARFGRR